MKQVNYYRLMPFLWSNQYVKRLKGAVRCSSDGENDKNVLHVTTKVVMVLGDVRVRNRVRRFVMVIVDQSSTQLPDAPVSTSPVAAADTVMKPALPAKAYRTVSTGK